jgi:hypothetical protein
MSVGTPLSVAVIDLHHSALRFGAGLAGADSVGGAR